MNVELANVGVDEFIVTWLTCDAGAPAEADTTVTYAAAGAPEQVATGDESAFHHIRISGLEPGTRYAYAVSSNGIIAPPDRLNPGAFTTLTPPPGKELFRVGVLADIHLGEEVSGIATSTPTELPPGYRSEEPYAATMLRAAVSGVNEAGASLTLLPADNSSHGERHDLERARDLLSELDGDYLIARGAHDRPGQYDDASKECAPDGDCFREVFRTTTRAAREPRHLPLAVTHRRWMFIALDSPNLESGMGELGDRQLAWLGKRLEKAREREWPVVIFFHHPVAEYSSTLAIPPAVFGVNHQDAQAFLRLIADYDVRLVINAHTHRNWIAYSPHTGRMPILEVGPTKEYPAGYSLLRFYEGGFIREWIPIDCDFCHAWRETTRGEYLSLYPLYTSGSLRERSFVHLFDRPDVPGIPSVPTGVWPPLLPGEA